MSNISFQDRDFKGSRFRCLMMSSLGRARIAAILTQLTSPKWIVSDCDYWAPDGFLNPDECRLDEQNEILDKNVSRVLKHWWLTKTKGAQTPNWDFMSSCHLGFLRGIILIEAKAHVKELKKERKSKGNSDNDRSIREALNEANEGLNSVLPGWDLSADKNYQLCNRFAWAWKVASLGVPVTLVYLGFLNANELGYGFKVFTNHSAWESTVINHAERIIPVTIWNNEIPITEHGYQIPLRILIKSIDVQLNIT